MLHLKKIGSHACIRQLLLLLQRNGLHHIATAAVLQWGQQPLPAPVAAPYDIMLCSDLVYQQHAVQQLLSSMRDLAGPGSVIFASCEYREGAGLEEMWRLMPAYGLQEELVSARQLWFESCDFCTAAVGLLCQPDTCFGDCTARMLFCMLHCKVPGSQQSVCVGHVAEQATSSFS